MFKHVPNWMKLMLGGALLFGSSAQGCIADALRDAADEIDHEDDDGLDQIFNDIEDWFD